MTNTSTTCWICGKHSLMNLIINGEFIGVHIKCEYPDGKGRRTGRHLSHPLIT